MQSTANKTAIRISPARHRERVAALQAKMEETHFDAFLVSHFANRRFLSGYSAPDHLPSETAGFLLVTPGSNFLITNFLYVDSAREETEPAGFEVVINVPGETFIQAIARLIRQSGAKRVGFESVALVFDYYEALSRELAGEAELLPTRGFIEPLRWLKDAEELVLMRQAIAISDRAFDEVRPLIQPGITEKQIAWEIERRVREFGGEALAFETIVASGPNGSTPHAVPGERVIEAGDPVIIDMGARYFGYNSDMTRTVCAGEPTARFKEIYNIVLEAELRACDAVRPGLTGNEVDAVARDIITQHGYGSTFRHSLGHGIGLAVHEPPSVSKGSPHVLAPGMIHSVEPGIYLTGWGGVRIEDLVLVTEAGFENLTGAVKDGYYQ
ncbi:MAG TPA: aminopeptidase P family protein [Chloroflexia bacterium]|nr:aminopeptidase P family protein [Chloroflexia bacterium]